MEHFIAQFLTREDEGPLLAEQRIAARVVRMNVRVHQNSNRCGAEFSNGAENFFGELLVLGIDHQDAVGAKEHSDPAARGIRLQRASVQRGTSL